jgi:two-component system sensor histidine kinase and response regulator WspE
MSQSQNQDRDLANLGDLSSFSMMDLFRMEADGQARTLTDGLLAMESKAGNPATVESLMRAAHSIKGAAAIVGLDVVVQLAHAMEDAFVAAQHGRLQLTPARIDVLLAGVDLIVQCSRVSEAGVAGWLGEHADRIAATMASIAQVAQLREAPPLPAVPAPAQAAVELFEQFEPFEPFAPATPATPAAPAEPAEPGALGAPRAAMQNYDRLLALASETRINAHQLVPTIASLQRFKRNQASLVKAVEQLHEALVRGATPALAEQCALVLQKTHPLKQFLHGHMADIDGYERRAQRVG